MEPITITPQFQEVLDVIQHSHDHLLITGRAGTGKSTLLRLIRSSVGKTAVVLSPTGLAAINVNGQTIHSFFHFSYHMSAQQAQKLGHKRGKTKLFQKLECIIIDEISMVRADILDYIDIFLKTAKGNSKPFGGVQVIMIGDVYQLPPVLTAHEKEDFLMKYSTPYFFSAAVIQSLTSDLLGGWKFVELQQVFRQSDQHFVSLLNDIRHGKNLPSSLQQLNQRVISSDDFISDETVLLSTTNRTADSLNIRNLNRIEMAPITFRAGIDGDFPEKEFPTNFELALKTEARVMFAKNDADGRWVNGTLGTVEHVSEEVLRVRLDTGKTVEVEPETWERISMEYSDETGEIEPKVVGTFTQIPLKLAWAITIHKSQGQTFNSLVLDLERGAFSAGQTYVALSRCRSLDGLFLKRPIYARDVRVDTSVDGFFEWLKGV